jgi:hypothetical protein
LSYDLIGTTSLLKEDIRQLVGFGALAEEACEKKQYSKCLFLGKHVPQPKFIPEKHRSLIDHILLRNINHGYHLLAK